MLLPRIRTRSVLFASIALCAVPAFAAPGADSAYLTDAQSSHVEDATSSGIGEVNMIACIMHAMRPDALVNEPSYIALIDKDKCDSEKQSSTANSGASDGAQGAANYITATVNSSRESNTAPMITKAWLPIQEEGSNVLISVHISATESPSDTNPYGAFRLDYCGQLDGAGACIMNGYLEAANGGINYYDSNSGGSQDQTTAMRLSVTSTGGNGRLEMHGGGNGDATFAFAYDDTLFHRDIDGDDQCFSRDARDPATGFSVWRYGMYDANTGARITRNSGFPIEFTAQGTTYHGYLGYYGLSLPPQSQALLANDSVVTKVDYPTGGGEPTRTDYHVMKADGKLIKFTKRVTTLAHLDQIRFTTFVGMEANDFFAGATPNTQYELYWNEVSQDFIVSGQMQCDQNGCQTSTVAGDHHVNASFWSSRGGAQGWSQSLGGEVFIDLHAVSGTIDSTLVPVVYRSQDIVYPADLPASLYCLQNCPTRASLEAYFNSSDPNTPASPYAGATFNNFNPTATADVVHYGTNADTAVLTGGDLTTDGVTFTDENAFSQRPQYANGVMSGRLFINLEDALCDAVTGPSAGYCDWKVNSADVYYQWQTGPNNWNQFAAVKDDSGHFVQFEAPLQLSFHVPDEGAYGQYRNTNIVLQYGGFGNLWGVPGVCVSANTNAPVDCSTPDSRYVPSFVIPYDQTLGAATSTGDDHTVYLIKWLDREIRFARKTGGECNALSLPDNSVPLPSATSLKNPSSADSDVYIGIKPTVTDAPRVIQGDVKF